VKDALSTRNGTVMFDLVLNYSSVDRLWRSNYSAHPFTF